MNYIKANLGMELHNHFGVARRGQSTHHLLHFLHHHLRHHPHFLLKHTEEHLDNIAPKEAKPRR